MIDLGGRHICVVGGSRGIGAAAATLLARAGADVSLTFRSRADAAAQVVAAIEAAGRRGLALPGDAAEEGVLDRAVDAAVARLGPLAGMVISAGIFEGARIESMTAAFWDRTMAVNLRASFLAVKAAARHMRAHGGGGSIVLYTSTAGQRGSEEYSAYAASKAGQIMFMRGMARELGPDRIRVNCIAPAWTLTDMSAPSLDVLGHDEVARGFALGRIGTPADVAGPTVFLMSDLAAFITGSTITVDGGMDMRG
jgi:3-oxoacyl-[acyl-carrier protein] reductase